MARLWHPGTYSVPKDMPEVVAAAALQAGMAVKEEPPKAAPEPVAPPQLERVEGEAAIPGMTMPEVAAAGEATFQALQGGDSTTTATEDEDEHDEDEDGGNRKRGRPRRRTSRKRAAPANKSRGRAPSNKAAGAGVDSADLG
jgi:hypothetical protein